MNMDYSTIPEREINNDPPFITDETLAPSNSSRRSFILGNTIQSSKEEIKQRHVIPTFLKDNEPFISHSLFIETMQDAAEEVFRGETFLKPEVRLSHPIPGRIPEARDKPAKELLPHEKTLFYERMAFAIEVPTVSENVAGNALKLSIGGVKAYNLDNTNTKSTADQTFKIFIGFQNTVCLNLCVWSDGYVEGLKVKDARGLKEGILKLFYQYDMAQQLSFYQSLQNYSLSEHQFAQMIGRCRLFQFMPYEERQNISSLQLSDTQLNIVAKDYFRDDSFSRNNDGSISLWRAYNLFTGATKTSYVDTFLDRTVSAASFVGELLGALDNQKECWFLR